MIKQKNKIDKKAQLKRGIALFLFIIVGFAVFDSVYYIHSTKYYEAASWGEVGINGISGMASSSGFGNKITGDAVYSFDTCTKITSYDKILGRWTKSSECRRLDKDKKYCVSEIIDNKDKLICVECFNGIVRGKWKAVGCDSGLECNKNHECVYSSPSDDPIDDYNNEDNPDKRCDYNTQEGRKACEKFGMECKSNNKCGPKESTESSDIGDYKGGDVKVDCPSGQELKKEDNELKCVDKKSGSCSLADRLEKICGGCSKVGGCDKLAEWISENANGIDPLLVGAVVYKESTCGNNPAMNSNKCKGLMQICSSTGAQLCSGLNYYSSNLDNIKCGVAVLKEKYKICKGGISFDCPGHDPDSYKEWNAGLRCYVGTGCTPSSHINYVEQVNEIINKLKNAC